MASDLVHRLVVTEAGWVKLRRRAVMRGAEWHTIPQAGETRVVYTTAELGEQVSITAAVIFADLGALPAGRNRSTSKGWLAVVADLRAEGEAKREPWECLGRVLRPLEHVELVAGELGVLVGRTADMVIVEVMDPPIEARFKALIRLQRGWHRRQVAA